MLWWSQDFPTVRAASLFDSLSGYLLFSTGDSNEVSPSEVKGSVCASKFLSVNVNEKEMFSLDSRF